MYPTRDPREYTFEQRKAYLCEAQIAQAAEELLEKQISDANRAVLELQARRRELAAIRAKGAYGAVPDGNRIQQQAPVYPPGYPGHFAYAPQLQAYQLEQLPPGMRWEAVMVDQTGQQGVPHYPYFTGYPGQSQNPNYQRQMNANNGAQVSFVPSQFDPRHFYAAPTTQCQCSNNQVTESPQELLIADQPVVLVETVQLPTTSQQENPKETRSSEQSETTLEPDKIPPILQKEVSCPYSGILQLLQTASVATGSSNIAPESLEFLSEKIKLFMISNNIVDENRFYEKIEKIMSLAGVKGTEPAVDLPKKEDASTQSDPIMVILDDTDSDSDDEIEVVYSSLDKEAPPQVNCQEKAAQLTEWFVAPVEPGIFQTEKVTVAKDSAVVSSEDNNAENSVEYSVVPEHSIFSKYTVATSSDESYGKTNEISIVEPSVIHLNEELNSLQVTLSLNSTMSQTKGLLTDSVPEHFTSSKVTVAANSDMSLNESQRPTNVSVPEQSTSSRDTVATEGLPPAALPEMSLKVTVAPSLAVRSDITEVEAARAATTILSDKPRAPASKTPGNPGFLLSSIPIHPIPLVKLQTSSSSRSSAEVPEVLDTVAAERTIYKVDRSSGSIENFTNRSEDEANGTKSAKEVRNQVTEKPKYDEKLNFVFKKKLVKRVSWKDLPNTQDEYRSERTGEAALKLTKKDTRRKVAGLGENVNISGPKSSDSSEAEHIVGNFNDFEDISDDEAPLTLSPCFPWKSCQNVTQASLRDLSVNLLDRLLVRNEKALAEARREYKRRQTTQNKISNKNGEIAITETSNAMFDISSPATLVRVCSLLGRKPASAESIPSPERTMPELTSASRCLPYKKRKSSAMEFSIKTAVSGFLDRETNWLKDDADSRKARPLLAPRPPAYKINTVFNELCNKKNKS